VSHHLTRSRTAVARRPHKSRRAHSPDEPQVADHPLLQAQRSLGNQFVLHYLNGRQTTAAGGQASAPQVQCQFDLGNLWTPGMLTDLGNILEPFGNITDTTKTDHDGPSVDVPEAIKYNRELENHPLILQRGGLTPYRSALSLPLTRDYSTKSRNDFDAELVHAVASWQAARPGLTANGKLERPTRLRFEAEGLTGPTVNWDQRDATEKDTMAAEKAAVREKLVAELLAIFNSKDDPQAMAGQIVSSKRQAVVDMATTQIGRVNNMDRGDGRKYGWERVRAFYDAAMPGYSNNPANLARIQKAGPPASVGAWSWCGIFAVWAVNAATGIGQWVNERPSPFPHVARLPQDPQLAGAQPGDILYVAAKNHHFVLAEPVTGPVLTTIDGAQDYEGINLRRKHKIEDVLGYYRTVDDQQALTEATLAHQVQPYDFGWYLMHAWPTLVSQYDQNDVSTQTLLEYLQEITGNNSTMWQPANF
jgi:hypothetical protein